jgi:hypothetical protein
MPNPRKSTELRQRLHELESLFDLLPVGVAICRDRECREMIGNVAYQEMLRLPPGTNPSKTGEQAEQLPFRVMDNGVEISSENLPLQVSAREGIAVSTSCQLVYDDGKIVIVQCHTVPLTDADGNPCGSVGVFIDVTEREMLIRDLETARNAIRTLTGLLPICAHCNKIRDRDERWVQFEIYVREHSGAEFSHTICPSCIERHFA